MRFAYGAATDVGLHRSENEDRFIADGAVFGVADGLGGHEGGGAAADIAVRQLRRRKRPRSLDELVASVGRANAAILQAARDDPRLRGMSTTLCVLADLSHKAEPSRPAVADADDHRLWPAATGSSRATPRLAVANVGDSRLYVLAHGELRQLTVDHTISANLVRDGLLTADQAACHPDRHVLTRAVGYEARVLVDGWVLRAVGGTRFLACSDGLTNELADPDIADVLRSVAEPAAAARRLVDAAVEPGRGRDNTTAVVVDVADELAAGDCDAHDMVLEFRPAAPG